jgi:hypothetical protein
MNTGEPVGLIRDWLAVRFPNSRVTSDVNLKDDTVRFRLSDGKRSYYLEVDEDLLEDYPVASLLASFDTRNVVQRLMRERKISIGPEWFEQR